MGVWYSRYAWWNVYSLGWDDPDSGPDGALKAVQTPFVGELFWAVMDDIGARRIVLVAGKDWWPEVRGLLDLSGLRPAERPVLAAGRSHGRQVVASYHPRGARQQGIRDEQLVEAVAITFARLEERRATCVGKRIRPESDVLTAVPGS